MTRSMMAMVLAVSCVLPAGAQTTDSASAPSYQAMAALRYVDLDFRGHRGQVQEYDGKVYEGAHGDVSVGGQGSYGLFDISLYDIGSTEEYGALNVDHKSGFKANARYQTMHHRLNYMRTGQLHNGVWVPKPAITLTGVTEDQDLVMRRTESGLGFSFASPENSARWASLQYWSVEKAGSMSWSGTGNPNIRRYSVPVDNTIRELALGLGTNVAEAAAVSLDLIRSDFQDHTHLVLAQDEGTTFASSVNGGYIRRPNGRQVMNGAEFRFRHQVGKDLALTGAFTGRQRENLNTNYKFNAVVGALNAAYRVNNKVSLLAKAYLRAFQIDENLGYFPSPGTYGTASVESVDTHQLDKTTVRGEFIATIRPIDHLRLKAAYKLEVNNRRGARAQVYSGDRYFTDGYFVPAPWDNGTAHSDTRHLFTLGAKAELPLGLEAEAEYKKLKANRPAFINLANVSDDINASLTAVLPQNLVAVLMAGYLQEKNTVSHVTQYSQTRNTYRAGLDWAGSSRGSFGADVSLESIRYFSELYLGSGAATPVTGTYHASAVNRQRNKVFGLHGRVNCPKGFVVLGNGSYTLSTIETPINYAFAQNSAVNKAVLTDFTPGNVHIARGTVAVEYTPEKLKNLTARASYSVADWVDKFDNLNSGRASIAQLGASMKF